jgi:hypothetical protein
MQGTQDNLPVCTGSWHCHPGIHGAAYQHNRHRRRQEKYAEVAIPADSFARAVAFAISEPEDVDVNEIVFLSTLVNWSSTIKSRRHRVMVNQASHTKFPTLLSDS